MQQIKISELTGAALDWAVCRCEGLRCVGNYAKSWRHCGPIIEREEITLAKVGRTLDDAIAPHPDCWCAHMDGAHSVYGPTPLIAAMRCYVASKLGDVVAIPSELI